LFEWVEAISKLVGIAGALITAYLGLVQYQRSVDQSIREFEWKRAEQSRNIVDALLKDEAWDAMLMLDWSEGRIYELPSKRKVKITPEQVPVALRAAICPAPGTTRTEAQRFVGDRFDRLFMVVGQMQVAVRAGLVKKGDVEFPLSWYVKNRLCRHKQFFLKYMRANSSSDAIAFLESMDSWRNCPAPLGSTQKSDEGCNP
jgi:hypothetical protein